MSNRNYGKEIVKVVTLVLREWGWVLGFTKSQIKIYKKIREEQKKIFFVISPYELWVLF